MLSNTRASALLHHVDSLIEKHRATADPELIQDLHAHRAVLQDALQRRSAGDIAASALRVATWVKFVYDHWPDL